MVARRRGNAIRPSYAKKDKANRALARDLVDTFRASVGQRKGALQEIVRAREEAAGTAFKRVRGLATLLERRCAFEMATTLDPVRARRAAWEAAARRGGAFDADTRAAALADAAHAMGATADEVEAALAADLDENLVLVAFDAPDPDALLDAYNVALTQTMLFDAVSVDVEVHQGYRGLFGLVKMNGLMYTLDKLPDGGYVLHLDGPASVLKQTRRYGSAIAKVVPGLRGCAPWKLTATIVERHGVNPTGEERVFEVDSSELPFPPRDGELDPRDAPVTFDSRVEQRFAESFHSLRGPWTLHREPALLAAGASVVIPDFGFAYGDGPPTVHLEIVGYWTPGYLRRKLEKLRKVSEDVTLVLAVNKDLGVTPEALADLPMEVVFYKDDVPLAPVARILERHAAAHETDAAAAIREAGLPDGDVVLIEDVARAAGTTVDAVERALPDLDLGARERVGNALVAPGLLRSLEAEIAPGDALPDVEKRLAARGFTDASSVLARLGFTVAWKGLDPSSAVVARK